MTLRIVQDEAADEVLSTNAFALLCGMLLQQEVSVDEAFAGPAKILDRFGSLDPAVIADAPADELAVLFAAPPPVHPYADSMAVLVKAMARHVVVNFGGDTASLWRTAGSGEHLMSRLLLVPGFNRRRAQMFVALLGKQLGVRPEGWEQAAGPYAVPDSFRSVADVRDAHSLEKVSTARLGRRKDSEPAGDDTMQDSRPTHNTGSRGSTHVNTDDERTESADDSEADEKQGRRGGGKKGAAAKAAKRAANKERRAAQDLADPAGADERAAKRAARRAAKVEGGGGAAGRGARKGGGRGARKRAESGSGTSGEAPVDAPLGSAQPAE